ncbi:MAG: hypothetical protein K2W96_23010, partial [Gemmataceae bacterium]|nr:hypothetical protein [Gemmataceae bacterium]
MRGKSLGLAALGLAISGLAALAQAPAVPSVPSVPSTPATPKAPAISPTLAAAVVNGESIYEVAVQRALERVPKEKRDEARTDVIRYLADNLVIDQSLRAAPAYKVPEADIDKRVEDMKAELKKIGKDFARMLGELRVTEAELRSHIGADLRWFKYASAQATDKALTELFTREKDMFDGTVVRARHILVTPKDGTEAAVKAAAEKLAGIKKAIGDEVEAGLAKL